jgi:hypothetical protein
MLRLITEEEFYTIDEKARFLAEFGSKRVHKNELKRFELQCNHLKPYLFDNVSYMLSELCSEVKSAFGNVKDKQHWLYFVNQTLYKIKSYGVEKD